MPDTATPQSSDHERRDLFRTLQTRWEEDIKTLTPAQNEPDQTSFMRDMLSDLIADAQGEINDLTDNIGDEIDWKGLGAAA